MRTTSRWLMPALSGVLFFGAVGVAEAAGWWTSSGRVEVVAGDLTSEEIKGWMTLGQAAEGLGVPVADLIALTGAPSGSVVDAQTAFKDVEGLVTGFELTAYRERVQSYLAAKPGRTPSVASTPTGTPTVPVTPSLPPATPNPTVTHVPTSNPTGTPVEGIRGSMTLGEVAEANGIELGALLEAARLPADLAAETALRDIQNTVPGFEIQTIRDAVAGLRR